MSRAKLDPVGFYRRVPLAPHQLQDRLTRTDDTIVLCHLGVPRLDQTEWSLKIDGLVERPLTLSFDDLRRYPKVEIASIHQCAGSPLQPLEPTRRICNVTWGGVRVGELLAECRPSAAAEFLWLYGADHGEFAGIPIEAYLKDLPLARVGADVLIAYEINGAPLPPEHGYPARLVASGFYGTNSVKWLTRITLADSRAQSPFTTRWYNDPMLDADGAATGRTTPVWSIAPESLIVSPAPDAVVAISRMADIWGWAWADEPVNRVEVSTDSGSTWLSAVVEPRRGRQWQRFSLSWKPDKSGPMHLASRAISDTGACQPASGQRNAIYHVPVVVS